jgi:hypothetical protein
MDGWKNGEMESNMKRPGQILFHSIFVALTASWSVDGGKLVNLRVDELLFYNKDGEM